MFDDISIAYSGNSCNDESKLNLCLSQLEEARRDLTVESSRLQDVRSLLNLAQNENHDLKMEVLRLRYMEHPGNPENNQDQAAVSVLRETVNELVTKNQDLKSEVGKMRYTLVLPQASSSVVMGGEDGALVEVTDSERKNQ